MLLYVLEWVIYLDDEQIQIPRRLFMQKRLSSEFVTVACSTTGAEMCQRRVANETQREEIQ